MNRIIGQQLPPGWVQADLSAIAQINPPLDRCIVSDNVPVGFIAMRAVEPEGGGILHPEVSTYGEVKKGYTAFLPGDVIMAKITPCMENGKTCVVPELPGAACFGSTEFNVIRTEAGIDARWVANFLLQHSTRHAAQRQMMGGVGQMRVPPAFMESLKIPVPSNTEQQRILDTLDELLSDLAAGVATLERTQEKLKQYRAAVLKAAVEGALTADWRTEHPDTEPASELLQRILAERRRLWEEAQLRKFSAAGREPPRNWKLKYQEPVPPDTTNLPTLPAGWLWVSAEQLTGFITKGTTPPGNQAPRPVGEVPFIKVQHLSGTGDFHFDESPAFVSRTTHETFLSRSKVIPGDILMNIVGPPLGQVSIVPADYPEWNINQAIAIFRPLGGISQKFIATCLLARPVLSRALLQTKTTAGQVNLTLEVCRSLPIPLPPLQEQQIFVEAAEDQLSLIDHLEADLEAKVISTHALRQSILRHVFSGQLVPQDPKDEPASELLKRIAAARGERALQAAAAMAHNGLGPLLRLLAAAVLDEKWLFGFNSNF
jgi:type I restriction enzyme S subunit